MSLQQPPQSQYSMPDREKQLPFSDFEDLSASFRSLYKSVFEQSFSQQGLRCQNCEGRGLLGPLPTTQRIAVGCADVNAPVMLVKEQHNKDSQRRCRTLRKEGNSSLSCRNFK
ncbi:hypothetical protein XENOCAPTIV_026402 [Xenoophorus captivus]|uniref:Uncharacterized protein n=1 Tax=Xenoophorus captivus TaxID=1517983 RepID=A0ABV0SDY8_9TELE